MGQFLSLLFVILKLTSLVGLRLSDVMELEQCPLISHFIKIEKHYFITSILLRTNFCQFSAHIDLSNWNTVISLRYKCASSCLSYLAFQISWYDMEACMTVLSDALSPVLKWYDFLVLVHCCEKKKCDCKTGEVCKKYWNKLFFIWQLHNLIFDDICRWQSGRWYFVLTFMIIQHRNMYSANTVVLELEEFVPVAKFCQW